MSRRFTWNNRMWNAQCSRNATWLSTPTVLRTNMSPKNIRNLSKNQRNWNQKSAPCVALRYEFLRSQQIELWGTILDPSAGKPYHLSPWLHWMISTYYVFNFPLAYQREGSKGARQALSRRETRWMQNVREGPQKREKSHKSHKEDSPGEVNNYSLTWWLPFCKKKLKTSLDGFFFQIKTQGIVKLTLNFVQKKSRKLNFQRLIFTDGFPWPMLILTQKIWGPLDTGWLWKKWSWKTLLISPVLKPTRSERMAPSQSPRSAPTRVVTLPTTTVTSYKPITRKPTKISNPSSARPVGQATFNSKTFVSTSPPNTKTGPRSTPTQTLGLLKAA